MNSFLSAFLVSCLTVFLSSYFLSSVFSPKDEKRNAKLGTGFLYILIFAFAQIVLTFEVLSLFKAITAPAVLAMNYVILAVSSAVWFKNDRPLYKPQLGKFFKGVFRALKKDKVLAIMAFGFVFFLLVTIFMNAFLPVSSYDALTYHLNRAAFWLHQGSLSHFQIVDDRNLVMPINSEILYLWVLTFLKNDIGLFFVSFTGYLASIFSLYNILKLFGFSERKRLWSVFILSSFASVIAEASSLETDILIAGLVLTSIFLFLVSLKERKVSPIFVSALAYALAMGTKSPSIIAFPACFLLMAFFAYRRIGKEFYKPLMVFLAFLAFNFIVFSSYNYILNYAQFGSFLGSESARTIHGFRGGFKAVVANYIRYIFMMFDFSGFRYSEYVGKYITQAKFALFDVLKIPHMLGVEMSDDNIINNRLMDVKMGAGLLGFLVFLPSVVFGGIWGFIKKSKKSAVISAFAMMFLLNLLCLSFSLAYMVFSVRFVTFLMVISSPVLAFSYIKNNYNPIKLLILFFVLSYFFVISSNLASRPINDITKVILETRTLGEAREKIRCSLLMGYEGRMSFCYLRDIIKSAPKEKNWGVFPSVNSRLYVIQMLNTKGYNIDVLMPERAYEYDLKKYDYLVTTDPLLVSTVLLQDTKDTKIEYKVNSKGDAYYDKFRPVSCVYSNQFHGFYNPAKKEDVITSVSCFLSEEFFNSKGFGFASSYDFKSDIKENANFMTIYKNVLK